MHYRRVACVASVLVLVGGAYACRSATEMTVRVTTTVPCNMLKGVGIAVAPSSADAEHRAATKFYVAQTRQCDSDSVVGTLVVTPGETSFSVIVVAGVDNEVTSCAPPLYTGCIVARRRLAFVDHRSLDVPIVLTRDCLDVPCNTETSCVHGNCKAVETTCSDTSCTQVGVSPDGTTDGGDEDGGRRDDGATSDGAGNDGGGSDGAVEDANVDGALMDGPPPDAPFTKTWSCLSSPGCSPTQMSPPPCSCSGEVNVSPDAGVMTFDTMTLECAVNAPRCNCLIDGQVANTVANPGVCSPTLYGACCNH